MTEDNNGIEQKLETLLGSYNPKQTDSFELFTEYIRGNYSLNDNKLISVTYSFLQDENVSINEEGDFVSNSEVIDYAHLTSNTFPNYFKSQNPKKRCPTMVGQLNVPNLNKTKKSKLPPPVPKRFSSGENQVNDWGADRLEQLSNKFHEDCLDELDELDENEVYDVKNYDNKTGKNKMADDDYRYDGSDKPEEPTEELAGTNDSVESSIKNLEKLVSGKKGYEVYNSEDFTFDGEKIIYTGEVDKVEDLDGKFTSVKGNKYEMKRSGRGFLGGVAFTLLGAAAAIGVGAYLLSSDSKKTDYAQSNIEPVVAFDEKTNPLEKPDLSQDYRFNRCESENEKKPVLKKKVPKKLNTLCRENVSVEDLVNYVYINHDNPYTDKKEVTHRKYRYGTLPNFLHEELDITKENCKDNYGEVYKKSIMMIQEYNFRIGRTPAKSMSYKRLKSFFDKNGMFKADFYSKAPKQSNPKGGEQK